MRDYVNRSLTEDRDGARRGRSREDGRAARAHRRQPRQRRADPDVGRRLRADGVRHRRDHGGAGTRSARLRLRDAVRPRDPARDRRRRGAPVHGRRPARQLRPALRRDAEPRGARGDRRLAGGRGPRPPLDQLPPARLAALAPALLGLPDPGRALRRLRPGARARRPAAGAPARRHRLQAEGQVAARRPPRTGSTPPARAAASRRCARRTRWTRSSTPRGTSCATATRATTRRRGTPRCSRAGRRPTSTSAASSTRSCT